MSWSASETEPEGPRPWGWTRIDGRNVFAVPAGAAVRLYDSDDFILLHAIAPSGHRSAVRFVRWSAFHGRLASLSATQIMVHAPQRARRGERVAYAPLCDLALSGGPATWVRNLAFSRCARQLLWSGHGGEAAGGACSLGLLDVSAPARTELSLRADVGPGINAAAGGPLLWAKRHEDCDVAKFSPNAFVFASLSPGARGPTVWRMKAAAAGAGPALVVAGCEALAHGVGAGDRVLYFSWRPARTPRHAEHETDGCHLPQWFEPARVLLTCSAARAIRVWTEEAPCGPQSLPRFVPALAFSPPHPIDNFRWVMSKSRHVSDERFRADADAAGAADEWVSGVDRRGVLHLWRVRGLGSRSPAVEETPFRLQVDDHVEGSEGGEESGGAAGPARHGGFGEACVMAYFSQNSLGLPSKFDIVLERADHIMLSFDVAVDVAQGHRHSLAARPVPRIRKKSWFRSHVGAIAALATHPSLPLVASVDAGPRTEVLIYWLSFSAFSAETRLIPSGVLPCDGPDVLCIQWIPTLHFDATPMLLVASASGAISVYGRSATAAGVVGSPSLPPASSPLQAPRRQPWGTFPDCTTRESATEYEVSVIKRDENDPVVFLNKSPDDRAGLVVAGRPPQQAPGDESGERPADTELSPGDELVAVDGSSVEGASAESVSALLGAVPAGRTVVLRLRASAVSRTIPELELPPRLDASMTFMDKFSSGPAGEAARELQRELLASLDVPTTTVVHTGAVSTYGGWQRLLRVEAAPHLALLCACPAYADDGEFVPDIAVVFALAALPGPLLAWRGARSRDGRTFELQPLVIERGFASTKRDITVISGERDYRQRAFSAARSERVAGTGLNSLLFVGDAAGTVEHWRCRVVGGEIHFTLMSAFSVAGPSPPPSPSRPTDANGDTTTDFEAGAFFRRGYVVSAQPAVADANILHIEVDDPNRVAVVRSDRPGEVDILEAESGLGILRLDASIREGERRGRVLGLCWCAAHVEFAVDALAVNYASGLVVYQFLPRERRWAALGDSLGGALALFDCSRDASALLIGAGSQRLPERRRTRGGSRRVRYADEVEAPGEGEEEDDEGDAPAVSNEMPMVVGKWDEPGRVLQSAMDWKAPVRPQQLPVWHPYVVLATLFGMHARVGERDTALAGDRVSYRFSRAFKDAVQMLKLLARVVEHDASARRSARTGVLSFSGPQVRSASREGERESESDGRAAHGGAIGRYSTAIHTDPAADKAEFLFAPPPESGGRSAPHRLHAVADASDAEDSTAISRAEMETLRAALAVLLRGTSSALKENALRLFGAFETEHLVQMEAILGYVAAVQALGFDLDASGADLGAKRFFAMQLFAKALEDALAAHGGAAANGPEPSPERGGAATSAGRSDAQWLREVPSSGVLWALHSDAQRFLLDRCCAGPQLAWQEHLRPMWLGLWVKDVQDLREVVERLAKQQYARSRDAMQVCLYYVALGKSNILGALAKMSRDDQSKTLAAFLEHDFSQERWCNAAVKNAYSLLSKKRFEASAAFFLLCEPPRLQEAVRVLAVRLGDPGLALVVARLVEHRASAQFRHDFMASAAQRGVTPAGDVAKRLLREDVAPLFRRRGDRWLESCALWWLEEFEQACAIISPPSQDVDVAVDHEEEAAAGPAARPAALVARTQAAARFYVNLTSITIYFQYLHSSDSAMLSWARSARRASVVAADAESPLSLAPGAPGASLRRWRLATVTDIEHAFSFTAYVCKRNGLSDTALVEMLQARHLINTHARFDLSVALDAGEEAGASADAAPTSPRFRSSVRRLAALSKAGAASGSLASSPRLSASLRNVLAARLSCVVSDDWVTTGGGAASVSSASPRRMSDLHASLAPAWRSPAASPRGHRQLHRARTSSDWSELVPGAEALGERPAAAGAAPWAKAQLADMECRRWASSAFVGKMIGLRVAREMISHFRADLDRLFVHFAEGGEEDAERAQSAGDQRAGGHRRYLEELCAPLCAQFQVDRAYVLEAALAVLHPHAHLHLAEVCFLLAQLRRRSALTKWIQYVALSVLRSCATFASCRVTDHVYRDWEGLTVQLCYLLHLDAAREVALPAEVAAQVAVAVRTGVLFLGWIRHRADVVHAAIARPFEVPPGDAAKLSAAAFATHLPLLRQLQSSDKGAAWRATRGRAYDSKVGFTFLGSVASYLADRDRAVDEDGAAVDPNALPEWGGVHSAGTQHRSKMRKMYTLVLLVSILRTLHARARAFLDAVAAMDAVAPAARSESDEEEARPVSEQQELDIASSLFTPRKLWKDMGEGPLEGVKRWFSLTESHLRFEFDYSVREVQCVCGLFGLDGAAFDLAARSTRARRRRSSRCATDSDGRLAVSDGGASASDRQHQRGSAEITSWLSRIESSRSSSDEPREEAAATTSGEDALVQRLEARGLARDLHWSLVQTSDDYVLALMKAGVARSARRFRADPRVVADCFLVRDAFRWFADLGIFGDPLMDGHAFLARCCKQRKLRLLVAHRGQDSQLFPQATPSPPAGPSPSLETEEPQASAPSISSDSGSAESEATQLPTALFLQAMMFVDPWEVEAVASAQRYLHGSVAPRHVELGRDRLSPLCPETCDGLLASVFASDGDLVGMWKEAQGEEWLVAAVTQFQLDGVRSIRLRPTVSSKRLAAGRDAADDRDEEEPRVPFLVEIHSRAQRNAMFQETGLPHRFVGLVTVSLLAARDLVSCNWMSEGSDPYVFLELLHAHEAPRAEPDSWSVSAYRSRVSPGKSPTWGEPEDQFAFRFAVPTHEPHVAGHWRRESSTDSRGWSVASAEATGVAEAEGLWAAQVPEDLDEAVDALEGLLPPLFRGPPTVLHCAVFHKNKVLAHQLLGRGEMELGELTSGAPLDCWVPLDNGRGGAVHLCVSLSFQLMCSSVAGSNELQALR